MVGEGGDGSGRRRRSGFSTAAPIRNRGKKAQGAQRAGYGRSVRASERRSVRAPAEPEAEDEGADWKRVAAQAVCEVERVGRLDRPKAITQPFVKSLYILRLAFPNRKNCPPLSTQF
jgi:hypothetical protein